MDAEVKILCVEDVPAEVVLLNHALREGGMNFRLKRVETQEAFLHEVEHNPPDVILSDHGLPSFDGFMALTLAQHKCPEIPFIFVTGKSGEEIAIETLKNGATDYILKRNLSKLVPAIRRALREAQERAVQLNNTRQLRESERRYRRLVEFCPDAFLVQRDGQIVFANRAAAWLLRFGNAGRLVSRSIREIIHPASWPLWESSLNRIIDEGVALFWRKIEKRNAGEDNEPVTGIPCFPAKFLRFDGTTLLMEVEIAPLMYQGGQAIAIVAREIAVENEQAALVESESSPARRPNVCRTPF